jgi:hypothetical protein
MASTSRRTPGPVVVLGEHAAAQADHALVDVDADRAGMADHLPEPRLHALAQLGIAARIIALRARQRRGIGPARDPAAVAPLGRQSVAHQFRQQCAAALAQVGIQVLHSRRACRSGAQGEYGLAQRVVGVAVDGSGFMHRWTAGGRVIVKNGCARG